MLVCSVCGREYADRWRCSCGGPLDFAEPPRPAGPPDVDARDGLWAFDDFLPVDREVSLGEGFSPLVAAPDWDCQFKLEYVFPSGSFKDRGATTTLSRAAGLGVEHVVEDSSGNAGAAIATYAARAGIDASIYVPASVKDSKLRAIERSGAEVVRVEGSRQAVTDACIDAVEAGDGWYASHAWNPAFFAGTATFAMEVAAQRDWSVPDAVVTPLGHGTLFLGAYRGFSALKEAGWTDAMPRLLGAQAAGYAPIVEELHGPEAAAGDNDAADGIQIRQPARKQQLLGAIDATGGDAIALDAEAVEEALGRLHRGGFYTEPTCAVAPAALDAYRERGVLDADADVVVPLTGSGLKT
ncbi:pyridoxal-phosphate dependent enzyme [Halorarius litoreus]|uniref:pyridoxal-phosphate dependent enzyme n=1 Tax=Halorarius litoreus TaxID=2962676 RepID=UPI0020CED930|nr:pyridoxal-phosphate dependent enzyme [Halorarius litoreus]